MFKDDYIMKIIQQAAAVMARVLQRLQQGEVAEAQEIVDEALDEFVGLRWEEVDSMSAEHLVALLARGEGGGIGRLLMLADLLRARGRIDAERSDDHAAPIDLIKALDIRLHLATGHDLVNAHLDGNIDELVNVELGDYLLPTETVRRLFAYYEKTDQYDKAENTLWELLEEHSQSSDLTAAGLEFYERLLRKSDSQLRIGNFSRQEVEAGFDELWARQG